MRNAQHALETCILIAFQALVIIYIILHNLCVVLALLTIFVLHSLKLISCVCTNAHFSVIEAASIHSSNYCLDHLAAQPFARLTSLINFCTVPFPAEVL